MVRPKEIVARPQRTWWGKKLRRSKPVEVDGEVGLMYETSDGSLLAASPRLARKLIAVFEDLGEDGLKFEVGPKEPVVFTAFRQANALGYFIDNRLVAHWRFPDNREAMHAQAVTFQPEWVK